jgi:hypothetical protein
MKQEKISNSMWIAKKRLGLDDRFFEREQQTLLNVIARTSETIRESIDGTGGCCGEGEDQMEMELEDESDSGTE